MYLLINLFALPDIDSLLDHQHILFIRLLEFCLQELKHFDEHVVIIICSSYDQCGFCQFRFFMTSTTPNGIFPNYLGSSLIPYFRGQTRFQLLKLRAFAGMLTDSGCSLTHPDPNAATLSAFSS